jgi:hypothetical protein
MHYRPSLGGIIPILWKISTASGSERVSINLFSAKTRSLPLALLIFPYSLPRLFARLL